MIDYKRNTVEQILEESGYTLLSTDDSFNCASVVAIQDRQGYRYTCMIDHATNNKKKPRVGPNNDYSLYNIRRYLELNNVHFKCISNEYVSATSDLEFECTKCGEHVFTPWNNVRRDDDRNRHHVICPNCDGRTESVHALVLKQIFKHEYPDSIEEEHSCRNPATGKILPTDIVNHRLKIAVEIQSQWHDFEDKKAPDAYKKQFWIDKGYSFYDPDIRDYSVLEMCQIFFDIDELPDYINYEYSNKINIKKFQKLLDDGLSVPEIECETGVNRHRIYDALYSGKLVYPNDYQNPSYSPIVQLDEQGNFVNEFDSINQARTFNGFKKGLIDAALTRESHYGGGYYWFRKEEYNPDDIKLGHRTSKFMMPVDKYDKDGNYICSYNTIIDASKDSNVSNKQIYNVVIGNFKQTGGYVYKQAI